MKRLAIIALLALAACTAPPGASPTGGIGTPLETTKPTPDESASSTSATCDIPEGCGPTEPPTDTAP